MSVKKVKLPIGVDLDLDMPDGAGIGITGNKVYCFLTAGDKKHGGVKMLQVAINCYHRPRFRVSSMVGVAYMDEQHLKEVSTVNTSDSTELTSVIQDWIYAQSL